MERHIIQDGVAPQCAVGNIDRDPSKGGRAYIPLTYATPRQIKKIRVLPSYDYHIPFFIKYYTETETKVPVGFLDSHSIGHYGWIFEKNKLETGYVTPK